MPSSTDTRKQLLGVLKKFESAMLVTRGGDGAAHARPMSVARLEDDGDMYFATSIESPKAREIEADPNVTVTMQGGGRFATVNGVAKIVRDQALIDRLWREAWRVWFPGGKADPNLCLISLDASRGEYWDNAGSKSVAYVIEAARAYATGETPKTDPAQNAKADL